MINQGMQSMLDDFKPMSEATVVVKVSLKQDKLTSDLATVLYAELIRVAGPVGESLLAGVDAEVIGKYLSTLSFMRKARVMSLSDKSTIGYRPLNRSVAVPVLWYQVLTCIGKALDRDYSIQFVPEASIEAQDLLSPEEMVKISDTMFRFQNNGFKIVAGIPLTEEGELDFMAMSHIGETVKSYRQTHPVYGFLASFFASHEVSEALGALVRVVYGYDSDYRTILTKVVSSVGSTE